MSSHEDVILDQLARLASVNPERVAFEFVRDGKVVSLTRGGMIERVGRLGAMLREGGHGGGAKVAIVMENRPAWAVAHFAIWYAGGVSVPLDPQLDAAKIGRILAHADASMVVTSAKYRDKVDQALAFTEPRARVQDIDRPADLRWDGADTLPDAGAEPWSPRSAPDGLGAVVYTSGTTGDPKGVMLGLDAIVKNMDAVLARVRIGENDRVLGVLPLYHMLPLIGNCLGIAYTGGRTTFLDSPTPESILAAFRDHRITLFPCVPLFFYRFHDRIQATIAGLPAVKRRAARTLMALCRFSRRRLGVNLGKRLLGSVHRPFGPAMRLLFTGGAKMNPEVHADLLDWGFVLTQGYGLTEATAALTICGLDEIRADSVGRAVNGVEVEIRDRGPDGIGEIWARGPSLMRGYYKNEEATSNAVVAGWLGTGDLGRLAADGHLTVTGRAKDVIVLASGKNVYPEELEEHFGQSEFIAELCIIGREDSARSGSERLHAVVVPDLDAARRRGYVNVREMVLWELENLGQALPSWQRPTSVEIRNQPLPRTTTRKLRRIELREETAGSAESAARTPLEGEAAAADPLDACDAELLAIIARRSSRETARRADHLDLDLGLDSLDRVELVAEIGARLGTRPEGESAGAVHTVGELIDLMRAAPGVADVADVADDDEDARWRALLADAPGEYLRYLRRSAVGEGAVWASSRVTRLLARAAGGFRVTGVEHLPSEGAFLVCPNHTSYLDGFVIAAAMPKKLLARAFFVGFADYFQSGLGRAFSRLVRNIPVDQNRHMEHSLQAAAEGLRRGLILIAFPEGGRSLDGTVQPFRRGPAILARQLAAPIVPVGIAGAFEAWPRDRGPRPHPIGVAFGAPLAGPSAEPHASSSAALSDALRSRIIELVGQARSLWGGPEGPA